MDTNEGDTIWIYVCEVGRLASCRIPFDRIWDIYTRLEEEGVSLSPLTMEGVPESVTPLPWSPALVHVLAGEACIEWAPGDRDLVLLYTLERLYGRC